MAAAPAQPVFYYDLGDPGCYLVAERIMAELPVVPEWEPVHGPRLGFTPPPPDRAALAAALARQDLQPLRLPATWPPDSELAMLAATYAKGGGALWRSRWRRSARCSPAGATSATRPPC